MEEEKNNAFERKFEYIRIRLYLMASLDCFYKLTSERVHLYSEGCFMKKMCEVLGVNKRKFSQYYKVAKTKLMALEDNENRALYMSMAQDYSDEFEINIEILPENYVLLGVMFKEFKD